MNDSHWWNPDEEQRLKVSGATEEHIQASVIPTHNAATKRTNPLLIVGVALATVLILAVGVVVAVAMTSSDEATQSPAQLESHRTARVGQDTEGQRPAIQGNEPNASAVEESTTEERPASEVPSRALSNPQWDQIVQESATVNVTGETDSAANQHPDSRVGARIPRIAGQSFDGSPIVIDPDDARNKIVVVIAHWASHAQVDVTGLKAWLGRSHLPENTDFILISSSSRSDGANYPPSRWLSSLNWPTPVLVDDDDSTAASALGVNGFPNYFFVSDQGVVEEHLTGSVDIQTFEDTLKLIFGSL